MRVRGGEDGLKVPVEGGDGGAGASAGVDAGVSTGAGCWRADTRWLKDCDD